MTDQRPAFEVGAWLDDVYMSSGLAAEAAATALTSTIAPLFADKGHAIGSVRIEIELRSGPSFRGNIYARTKA